MHFRMQVNFGLLLDIILVHFPFLQIQNLSTAEITDVKKNMGDAVVSFAVPIQRLFLFAVPCAIYLTAPFHTGSCK